MKAGITGTGSLIGQAIIKSIKAGATCHDIPTAGFDYFPDTIGSHWVDTHYILPDILKEGVTEDEWLEEFICIAQKEKINVIFVGVDFELGLFAKNKDRIYSETGCKVMVSTPEVIKISDDKYLTYEFLKDNGLHYPLTALPEDLEGSKITFPCILKPRRGSRSENVSVIKHKKELEKKLPFVKDPVIQELIGSPEVEYTCGVICLDDGIKHAIVLRRDLKDGNTQTAYFRKDTPTLIYDYIRDITEKLMPFGVCNFQLRLDADGLPKVFEINARHSGTTYMRALFGFNEVEYILAHIAGIKIKEFDLKEGIVKRYHDEIFIR